MLLRTITLSNSGNVCLDGGGYILALGYECNRGIYQLQLRPTGEWDGLTIQACWHLPDGTSTTTLAVDGYVDVPAAVTALPGTGCITFEGAAEGKTITSSDLRYLVGDNSGTTADTLPEPNTPAWEQLVGTVAESATQAEEAADRADKAAAAAEGALTAVKETASKALTDITHTGAAQTQAVTRAGEQAVQEVDAAAQAGVGSVEQAVQTAATAAIQRVEQTGSTQVQAVTAAGAEQVQAVEAAAAEKLAGITQLAGQAASSATKAEQAAQRAEEAADATSTIIDDTAITSARTWSSLHILDTLCPPIKATGNPVVCHPVAGYPLNVTVDFAPIQEGAGDPSPENVRPIKARESVDVTRCGETLWSLNKITLQTYNSNITTKIDMDAVNLLPRNVQLYFSGECSNGTLGEIRFYDGIGAEIGTLRANGRPSTVLKSGNIATVRLYAGPNENSERTCTNLQITLGTTAPTTFAPYTGQTTTLTLPAPCYGGELDAVSGKGQETWALLTLMGEEGWSIVDTYIGIYNLLSPTDSGKAICTHFAVETSFNGDCLLVTGGGSIYLGRALSNKYTVDTWCAYLAAQYAAGTPVQIAYKVATPTPITATGGKPIPALAGTNTVLTDGDSLTVTGRSDPTHEIQQLRAAVVALGGTI